MIWRVYNQPPELDGLMTISTDQKADTVFQTPAAIVFTALLKRYAPDKTMIVGEPMGEHAQVWVERGISFKPPNSGY